MKTSELVRFLRCPSDGEALELKQAKRGPQLVCRGCKAVFPVTDGIPRFPSNVDPGFDERWHSHPRPQRDLTAAEVILEDKTGWHPWDMDGKVILEAGCGCGRFPRVIAKNGGVVIGVDGSLNGLKAALENVPEGSFVQGNLLHLPIVDGSVDMALSVGAIHHTADPARAFAEVARTVKVGGQLAVWVYCCHVTDPRWLPALELFHDITRACPPEALHAAIERHAVRVRDSYRKEWGPLQQILRVSNSEDDEECVSDTFDWHTPQRRSWHTEEEVRGWFEANGYEVDRVGKFSVSVRGVRVR